MPIDNSYNRKINQQLIQNIKQKHHWEPDSKRGGRSSEILTGGSVFKVNELTVYKRPAYGSEYIQPGTACGYPQYNSTELKEINTKLVMNDKLQGGDFWSDVGNFFKPVASAALDIAAPALGAMIGGPTGAVLAKGAREGLHSVTGWGKRGKRKSKSAGAISAGAISGGVIPKAAGVGNYEVLKNVKAIPSKKNKSTIVPTTSITLVPSTPTTVAPKTKTKSTTSKTPSKRAEIVKKIMNERGVKMIEASKIVKNEGLYTK